MGERASSGDPPHAKKWNGQKRISPLRLGASGLRGWTRRNFYTPLIDVRRAACGVRRAACGVRAVMSKNVFCATNVANVYRFLRNFSTRLAFTASGEYPSFRT